MIIDQPQHLCTQLGAGRVVGMADHLQLAELGFGEYSPLGNDTLQVEVQIEVLLAELAVAGADRVIGNINPTTDLCIDALLELLVEPRLVNLDRSAAPATSAAGAGSVFSSSAMRSLAAASSCLACTSSFRCRDHGVRTRFCCRLGFSELEAIQPGTLPHPRCSVIKP